jgi:hypothetical protein
MESFATHHRLAQTHRARVHHRWLLEQGEYGTWNAPPVVDTTLARSSLKPNAAGQRIWSLNFLWMSPNTTALSKFTLNLLNHLPIIILFEFAVRMKLRRNWWGGHPQLGMALIAVRSVFTGWVADSQCRGGGKAGRQIWLEERCFMETRPHPNPDWYIYIYISNWTPLMPPTDHGLMWHVQRQQEEHRPRFRSCDACHVPATAQLPQWLTVWVPVWTG